MRALAARCNGEVALPECVTEHICKTPPSPELIAPAPTPDLASIIGNESIHDVVSSSVCPQYDWKRLDTYAKVMESHEAKRQLAEKRNSQEKIRRDLDKQVDDLRARKEAEKKGDIAYYRNVNSELEQWMENDARVARDKSKRAELEKEDHLEQLRFDSLRKQQAESKHRNEDSYILKQIEKELHEEEKETMDKKRKEREAFKRLMKENEIGRMQQIGLKKKQIEEEIRIMEENNLLMEAQEEERNTKIENRLVRQKLLVKKMEENVTKRLNEKANDDNIRALKQQAEKDARSIEIEAFKIKKYNEMKADMIRTLEEQVAEKLARKQEEDEIKNMHAEILKLDSAEFAKYENQRKELTKKLHNKYKEQLLKQIALHKEKNKTDEECMNTEEFKINRDLIEVVEKTLHEDEIKSVASYSNLS